MDSKTRIKNYIKNNFPEWEKVDFSTFDEVVDFDKDYSELYRINNEEVILISYTNISITGTDRSKPQLRVFLEEYKKPFYFAKKHQLRFYLFSIFTKDDEMARGLNNFNPKDYIISIETNLDSEGSRRDLRSIYDYADTKLNGKKFLKCSRTNYRADINQASFIYIGPIDNPDKTTFENFVNIFDSRPYLNSTNSGFNDVTTIEHNPLTDTHYFPFLAALRTKPFLLLAGISGTGKSQKVQEFAFMSCPKGELREENETTPGNFCLVEVKPNWHDSTELLGYYSALSGCYELTDFIRFAYKALMNPDVPFFLCLDEMNLAPVEQYFAEFLSVLETRKKTNEGIRTQPLLTKDKFSNCSLYKCLNENDSTPTGVEHSKTERLYSEKDSEIIEYLKENGLTLPDNLFVIGTVNMDDTTHQFSRKVIDRAFTIEMNGGKMEEMFSAESRTVMEYRDEPIPLSAFKSKFVRAYEVLEDNRFAKYAETIKTKIPKLLGNSDGTSDENSINGILNNTPFRVSYRVQNELVLYLSVLIENAGFPDDIEPLIGEATLAILMEKVLPRIQGEQKQLETKGGKSNVLKDMKSFVETHFTPSYETVPEICVKVFKKLDEMDGKLSGYYTNFF
jgi:hypothetical protein